MKEREGVGQGRDICSEREREGSVRMTRVHALKSRIQVVCLEGEKNICDFSLGS